MGQEKPIVFSHLNVSHGLSQNQINCICRDSKGFIWFGTNAGLNRFDGINFEVFNHEKKGNRTLANNTINAITEDKNGDLWIGTANGVSILDGITYQIRNSNYPSVTRNNCGDIFFVNALTLDSQGNVWIATNNGCFVNDIKKHTTEHILVDSTECNSPFNGITSLAEDLSDNMWMSTENGYIQHYNSHTRSFEKFKIPDYTASSTSGQARLFIDRDNDLWVGDLFGLNLFNIKEKKWDVQFQNLCRNTPGLKRIGSVSQDAEGLIWIASDGDGVFRIDKRTLKIKNIRNKPFDDQSLSSNGISKVLCDREGIVWLGTTKKGVSFYRKNIHQFRIYKNVSGDDNSLGNNDVNAVVEDSSGNIWIGTDGGGLNYLDRKTQKITRIEFNSRIRNSLSSNIIVSLYRDHAGSLWIGTYFGGLNRWDPLTGKFSVYKNNPKDSTSISDDRIYGISEDETNHLWVGTLGAGLNRFDPKKEHFERFNISNSTLCSDLISSIYQDKSKKIWISTTNGLAYYDTSDQALHCLQIKPKHSDDAEENDLTSCFIDSRGFFWVCTKKGLFLLDNNHQTVRQFTMADGLPSNTIHRIVEDKNNCLWISSKDGISKLIIKNVHNIHTFEFNIINYTSNDGLQGNEFNESSALCTLDGELFFGGPDGLNAFYPDEIKDDTVSADIVLRDFKIFNKKIPYGQKYNGRILLKRPIFNTEEITLKYQENSFTIDFIALNYFYPEKSNYVYKLDGFNNEWINTSGKQNSATYTNLNNGTYTFHVKELKGNSGGKEISLKIIVLPPFWKSGLAYVLYFMIIVLLLWLLRMLILARERLNMKIKNDRLEARHLHDIDVLKIKFFTNISHEFRTPLTLIMAPVEKMLTDFRNRPEEKNMKLIKQNANRLLRMVNQLLDFRKLEVQGFTYNPSFGNIVSFIEETVQSFHNLSEQKHIHFTFQTQINELITAFDQDKLEKIIFNLLSNAFKFTHDYGHVSVSLLLQLVKEGSKEFQTGSNLVLKVEDTGIGIPQEKIGKIFTRFFQIENSGHFEEGTGIGLSLVAEFVKLHNGEISVFSEVEKGSCFVISLPVVSSNTIRETVDHSEPKILNSILPLEENTQLNQTNDKPVVLIVEDNEDLRFFLKDNLSQKYTIYEAENGLDALLLVESILPDLIISDIMMPGLDGIELCRRVKTDRTICHIPVILLTARTTEQQQLEGLENGADDYITKPFNFQILETKIYNSINLRRKLRQVFKNKLLIEPREITVTSLDEQFIHKAMEFMEINMSSPDCSVETMSRDMRMSRTHLYKKMMALTGLSPQEFIRSMRLKRGAMLLNSSQLTISEIAFMVGFNNPKYFTRHFKNEFGVLPSKYIAL